MNVEECISVKGLSARDIKAIKSAFSKAEKPW